MDISYNSSITKIRCENNALTYFNAANGNNTSLFLYNSLNNDSLTCVIVDNPSYSDQYWLNKDVQTEFNIECSSLSTEDVEEHSISIFPNPVKDMLNIEMLYDANYALITVNGQFLIKGSLITGSNIIPLDNISNGIYFLQIVNVNGSVYTHKIIKD